MVLDEVSPLEDAVLLLWPPVKPLPMKLRAIVNPFAQAFSERPPLDGVIEKCRTLHQLGQANGSCRESWKRAEGRLRSLPNCQAGKWVLKRAEIISALPDHRRR